MKKGGIKIMFPEQFNLLSIFTLLAGLAFFLFGMNVMSGGLEKMSGGKLETGLQKLTSNKAMGLALGAGITIAIQSSSAMTVMLVGFVNSGIMQLSQTISVMMGSNVGTTLTAWITALNGINGGGSAILNALKPESFSPVFALVGIMLIMLGKSDRKKQLGTIFIGFSILMYGMIFMSDSMSPLKDMPEFESILKMFSNPILGVLIATALTGIIQSSAATIAILQALALSGGITYNMAIPLILGANIGTCATALLSSFGVNKNAKRVTAVHISIKVIGTVIVLGIFYLLDFFVDFAFKDYKINAVEIAIVHTVFNVVTTAMMLPFSKQLEKLACLIVKDKSEEKQEEFTFIDERLLSTPSIAVGESKNKAVEMCVTMFDSLLCSTEIIFDYDEKKAKQILKDEDKLDIYEDKLGKYLVKLSRCELTVHDSKVVSELLHCIGDFERIGDHAVNILKVAQEIKTKKLKFSSSAEEELKLLISAITEIITITRDCFQINSVELAKKVEPLEQVIDRLTKKIKNAHVDRLSRGECTIEIGFVLSDLINNFERVSDHCSNIAVSVLETEKRGIRSHEYLNNLKYSDDREFNDMYEEFKAKYYIQ